MRTIALDELEPFELDTDHTIAEDATEYENNTDEIALNSLKKVIGAWAVGAMVLVATFFGMLQIEDEDKVNRHLKTRTTTRAIKVRGTVRKMEYAF